MRKKYRRMPSPTPVTKPWVLKTRITVLEASSREKFTSSMFLHLLPAPLSDIKNQRVYITKELKVLFDCGFLDNHGYSESHIIKYIRTDKPEDKDYVMSLKSYYNTERHLGERTEKEEPLDSDRLMVEAAKKKIVEISKISIFQIGEAEEAVKASLRMDINIWEDKYARLKKDCDENDNANIMLQKKVAKLIERVCELEGNRAAVSSLGDKSIAEIKDQIAHPVKKRKGDINNDEGKGE